MGGYSRTLEVVGLALSVENMLEKFEVGQWVLVLRGEFAGWYGTVTAIDDFGYLTVDVGACLTRNLHTSEVMKKKKRQGELSYL